MIKYYKQKQHKEELIHRLYVLSGEEGMMVGTECSEITSLYTHRKQELEVG